MSEANLWDRIRNNIGHTGHFVRVENAVMAGYPDVDYCIKGTSGKIELKYKDAAPKRKNTAVFSRDGLRDEQVAWIYTRVKHGGLVWILPQVGKTLYLLPGKFALSFNRFNLVNLEDAAYWSVTGAIRAYDWQQLVDHLAELR